jgi:hypothetical protein
MLLRVALLRTDISVESIVSIIKLKVISELGTTLALTATEGCWEEIQESNGVTSQKTALFLIFTIFIYNRKEHKRINKEIKGIRKQENGNEEIINVENIKKKQTPWPLVSKRTIPTEGPPLVDQI